jgi:hypothetical protein
VSPADRQPGRSRRHSKARASASSDCPASMLRWIASSAPRRGGRFSVFEAGHAPDRTTIRLGSRVGLSSSVRGASGFCVAQVSTLAGPSVVSRTVNSTASLGRQALP